MGEARSHRHKEKVKFPSLTYEGKFSAMAKIRGERQRY